MGVRDSLLVEPTSLWLSVGSERFRLWSISVSDLVAKLRRCFVDLRFQRTGSATM